MDKYLQGFNDGYKKAMEQTREDSTKIAIDGSFIKGVLEPEITLLQKRGERTEQLFRA